MMIQSSCILSWVLLATSSVMLVSRSTLVSAYITTPSALPQQRQIKWLKELTTELCESPVGELSDEMLGRAPEIMRAWCFSKGLGGTESALAVESLVKRVIDERQAGNLEAVATTDAYNCLISGWARSRAGAAAAERSEQILTAMQEAYEGGDAFVQPNISSFKGVLMAWKVSGVPFAQHRAQRILEWMIRLYTEEKNDLAMPDSDCFDIVLQLWSRSGVDEAPVRAERVLTAMERSYLATGSENIKPKTSSFNAVLAAWSKSKQPGSADRIADILSFMEMHSKEINTSIAPDIASYTTAVTALARIGDSKSSEKAESFLGHVEQAFRKNQAEGKSTNMAPDTILFNSVMGCWAKANVNGSFRKNYAILDRQIKIYEEFGRESCKPDVYGFTSVIGSCANEQKDRKTAFEVAHSTFKLLHQYDKPNHVTYGTMLKACSQLLDGNSAKKKRIVASIFNSCIKDGCVGEMVIGRLREATSNVMYKDLMQGYTKNTIPSEWTRNVVDKKNINRSRGAPTPRRKNRRAEV